MRGIFRGGGFLGRKTHRALVSVDTDRLKNWRRGVNPSQESEHVWTGCLVEAQFAKRLRVNLYRTPTLSIARCCTQGLHAEGSKEKTQFADTQHRRLAPILAQNAAIVVSARRPSDEKKVKVSGAHNTR